MPSPTRPNSYPLWTQGNNAVRQQPTNGEQFTGFTPNFRPPAGWHNWLFGIVSDWISWLDYATQGNMPVSNVGHNIILGTTAQQQFDQIDAFLSSLGFQTITLTPTVNPLIYTVAPIPFNNSAPLVFLDGLDEKPTTDFTFAVTGGIGRVTFVVAPAAGQTPYGVGLTANTPGPGGSSVAGGFIVYGAYNGGVVVTGAGGVSSTNDQRALFFTVSPGGAVPVTANPQVTVSTKAGAELRLVGTSDTDYIVLADGNGLKLNGSISLKNGVSIDLWWNGTLWAESDRSS